MNKKRRAALEKMNNMKTFGKIISEGRDKCGMSKSLLVAKITERKGNATERDVTLWEKDLKYPDITIIYLLAEILKLDPIELLESKHVFQEAGLNSIDMVTMRVVCKLVDMSIMGIFYMNRVLFWIALIGGLIFAWGKVGMSLNM